MIRIGKAHFLACALLGIAPLAACSSDARHPSQGSTAKTGSIGLELQLPGGFSTTTVHYVISGSNGFSRSGDIDASQNTTTFSAFIGGLPPGGPSTITLVTSSVDGSAATCIGAATFTVVANATTAVNVSLRCRGYGEPGTVIVNGTLNICPSLELFGARPLSTAVGTSIDLESVASDVDGIPSPLTYAWTDGTGFNASTPNATYPCAAPGVHHITLTVRDGDPGCEAIGTADVTCTGDGGSSGTGGSAGAPPDGGSGGSSGTGGAAGSGGAGGTAGAGTDGGDTAIVTVEELLLAKSPACLACAQSNCAPEIGGCIALRGQTALAGPSTGASREVLCTNTVACVFPPGVTSCGTGFLNACYCGTAANEACLSAGNADGVCKSYVESGLETTDPGTIAVAFTRTTLGAGAAMALAQCLDGTCNDCFTP